MRVPQTASLSHAKGEGRRLVARKWRGDIIDPFAGHGVKVNCGGSSGMLSACPSSRPTDSNCALVLRCGRNYDD
jgi:hypothetical protein